MLENKLQMSENNSDILEMLKWIQAWIWSLSESVKTLNERVDAVEKRSERDAQLKENPDKIRDKASRNSVPKAVKVIQYITNPDWTQEYKLPWRTFRSSKEAEWYIQELSKQWKTFTKFFV